MKDRQGEWKVAKVDEMGVKGENIIFDKRRKVASSTSHKNAARVPASPPDIQPLRLSLC
jgi:hypothetical protein